MSHLLGWRAIASRRDVDFRIVDNPAGRPTSSIILVYDIEKERAGLFAVVAVREVRVEMIFGREVGNTFMPVVMDFPVGGESHPQRPPACMCDFRAGHILPVRVGTNQDLGEILFLTRLLFQIQLDEEAWPVLFQLLRSTNVLEKPTDGTDLVDCCRTIRSKPKVTAMSLFPFVKRWNVDATNIAGGPRNGHHIAQFLLDSRNEVVLLKRMGELSRDPRV